MYGWMNKGTLYLSGIGSWDTAGPKHSDIVDEEVGEWEDEIQIGYIWVRTKWETHIAGYNI